MIGLRFGGKSRCHYGTGAKRWRARIPLPPQTSALYEVKSVEVLLPCPQGNEISHIRKRRGGIFKLSTGGVLTDIAAMDTIAERIATRLQQLGKNPSAVALEAGLGRSSVRDILVGKVSSPRLDTLEKLTGPLDCTLEYLTGLEPSGAQRKTARDAKAFDWYDPMEVIRPSRIEAGVFRTAEAGLGVVHNPPDEDYPVSQRHLSYNDLRLPEHFFAIFEMGDTSLEGLHILPGDILTVATPHHGVVPMKRGTVLLVRRHLGESTAEELSARYVDIIDGNIVLTSRSTDPKYKPIPITDTPGMEDFERQVEELLPNYYYTDHGTLIVEGVVVRITRAMPA